MRNNHFIPNIIDVEASGFGPFSYPIEVGVINQQGEKYCRLVKPLKDWAHWDIKAQELHGISREALIKKGLPIQQLCQELNVFLNQQTVYSDGWVVDQPWLIKLFHSAHIPMEFHISPLEMILNEGQMAIWHNVKDNIVSQNVHERHRASGDASIIQSTFMLTQEQVFQGTIKLPA